MLVDLITCTQIYFLIDFQEELSAFNMPPCKGAIKYIIHTKVRLIYSCLPRIRNVNVYRPRLSIYIPGTGCEKHKSFSQHILCKGSMINYNLIIISIYLYPFTLVWYYFSLMVSSEIGT